MHRFVCPLNVRFQISIVPNLRPLLWFMIPLALFVLWKSTDWAFQHFGCTSDFKSGLPTCYVGSVNLTALHGLGWWGALLWFPFLLLAVVRVGIGFQRQIPSPLLSRLTVTYKDAISFNLKAFILWAVITVLGIVGSLVVFYPIKPSSVIGWFLLSLPWVPLWLAVSWLQQKRQSLRDHSIKNET